MIVLFVLFCVIFIGIIVVQIGKVIELVGKICGEEEVQEWINCIQVGYFMIFMIVFFLVCIVFVIYYKDSMLWYGFNEFVFVYGSSIDYIFNIILFFMGIVFFIIQILLFYFVYKYCVCCGLKVEYILYNNCLEVIWIVIFVVVMIFFVVGGFDVWNDVMVDVEEGEDYIEIEVIGYQFVWYLCYFGLDGKLGVWDYKMILVINLFGQVWLDEKNLDDFYLSEIVLLVGKKVCVWIIFCDVLYNFYLFYFCVKMDVVLGMLIYFVFILIMIIEEYCVKFGVLNDCGEF